MTVAAANLAAAGRRVGINGSVLLTPESIFCKSLRLMRATRADNLRASCGRGEKQLQDEIKFSMDLPIIEEGAWAAALRALNVTANDALQQIVAEVPALQIWPLWWTGYKIQHYRKNEGHFKWHFDAIAQGTWERQLAMVIYSNSVPNGGETCFQRQDFQVKPIAGNAVIFPTFWTHAHCGKIPRSEDKYIVSSFVSFAIPTASPDKGPEL